MTHPFLLQSDDRWKHHKLGTGASTFWGGGCVLCNLTEAAADFGTIAHRDPRIVNDIGVARDCFVGSDLKIPEMAAEIGLKCGPRVELIPDVMGKALMGYLASGRQALLAVDHDKTLPNGDPGGEHWLRAIRLAANGIVASDPAVGEATLVDVKTLVAPAQWGKQRHFTVVAFRTLAKA